VYAIPYEGEEVKLHWANHDQYYIKTSEYLRDYTFKLPSGKLAHFKLAEADIEKDNRKETDDKKRRFILAKEPLAIENSELAIRFEFRPDDEKRAQKKLNEQAVETILGLREQVDEQAIKDALAELATLAPTEKNKKRTLLAKHLGDYTRRNTQDYFIHKDLGKFLRRELDFFIKNEIMHLDNIENETVPKVEQYLSKIKVIRKIAHKLIDFLAQIEDFQKKLWLKKKFVVETHYCFTLDRVPEELYPEIAVNDAQQEEWVKNFAVDEIKGDMFAVAFSNPLSVDFLKANPFLTMDTKFFGKTFKYHLLASINNLNDELDGVLISSENFQAVNLLRKRYTKNVKCIYIDPPYNTKNNEILYKNTFKHSSWISLMENRISLSKYFLRDNGVYVIAIDEVEQENLGLILSHIFHDHEITCITVVHNPSGQQGDNFSSTHEYAYFVYPLKGRFIGLENRIDNPDIRPLRDVSKGQHLRDSAANCFYPIFVKNQKIIGFGDVCKDSFHPSSVNVLRNDGVLEIYPIDAQGNERKWVFSRQSVEKIKEDLSVEFNRSRQIWDIIRKKIFFNFKTVWNDKKYSSNSYGSKLLNNIMGEKVFSFPKSINTTRDCILAGSTNEIDALVVDLFAGSGTTGHAVITLNRKDIGKRKYVLVEMGQYFNTVLKPRIQKVIYSVDWKDGKPVSRKGSSHAFKYIKLESYEDTLNNLELELTEDQAQALLGAETFKEDYMLHYMLDFESKDSLLDLKIFETPFDYQLKIASSTVGETVPTRVDLVETFNYLLGLQVSTIRKVEGVVLVEGRTNDNKNVLVIWRNVNELDNDKLNSFFTEYFGELEKGIDIIYVNGDNTLANNRPQDVTWKVNLIEKEFHYRMFEEG